MKKPFDWFNWNVRWLVIVAFLVGLFPLPGLAQTIVWTDENGRRIQSKDVSGGPVQTLAQFPADQFAYGIQHDPITGKLYYHFWDQTSSFRRINIDGSNPETIPTPSAGTFAINTITRKLYWTLGIAMTLHQSNLDGSDHQTHAYSNCCYVPVLAIDNELYLAGYLSVIKGLWRADADGSNEQLLHSSGSPTSAAYDPVEDKVYWLEGGFGVHRINRDGTGYQYLFDYDFSDDFDLLTLDYRGRKLYWTNYGARTIQRANLDGTNIETVVTAAEAGNPNLELRGLTIVQPPIVPAMSVHGAAIMFLAILAAAFLLLKRCRSCPS